MKNYISPVKIVFLFLSGLLLVFAQSQDLLVNTQYGPVLGHTTSTNKRWLGIPYAAPPVGNLRWQTPQAPSSWTTVLNASSFSFACPQGNAQTPLPPAWDEDCLYLNVFAPRYSTRHSALPVYVYVYGGAWTVGYTQKYEGSFLTGQDIIVVTMNYRLGALGFLASPLLLGHSPENTTGMYAVQDQRMALKWVKDNIAGFGGDPNRVTLGGQSAGAALSCIHLTAPRSAGLFNQIVMQSSFCAHVYTEANGYATSAALLARAGCNGTDEQVKQCMFALTPSQILAATTSFLLPTLHAYEILDTPLNLVKQGQVNAHKLLMGNTKEEMGAIQCNAFRNGMTATQYNSTLQSLYPSFWEQVYETYPLASFETPLNAYIAVTSDNNYNICNNKAVMDAFAGYFPGKIWVYLLEQAISNPGPSVPAACAGSAHGFDLYFLYPSYLAALNGSFTAAEQQLAVTMRNAWASFVKNGYPIMPNYQHWPTYTWADGKYVALKADDVHIDNHYKTHECPVWGVPSPVCTASVALVARAGSSWVSNGVNYQLYDVKVQNIGDQTITALTVRITPGSNAVIAQKWNLNPVSSNLYSLPFWYQGFAVDGSSTDAGFILSSTGTLAPSITTEVITC